MLKYALIIVFIASSAQFAHADDRAQDANDGTTEQAPPRKDVYKKLGITNGDSESEQREPAAAPEQQQTEQQPQQQQQKDDSGANTTAPRDTSEQPVN